MQVEFVGRSERSVPKARRHLLTIARTHTRTCAHLSQWKASAMKWQCETPAAQPCRKRFDGASVWRAQKQQAEPEWIYGAGRLLIVMQGARSQHSEGRLEKKNHIITFTAESRFKSSALRLLNMNCFPFFSTQNQSLMSYRTPVFTDNSTLTSY